MPRIQGIYALCDNSLNPKLDHIRLARQLLEGGVSILQLRMKGEKNLRLVQETARSILELKREFSFTFILNDFAQLAADLPVDGVHLGQEDLSIEAARAQLGAKLLIGYSSHSLEEALEAEQRGADYIAFGAIYPTATKGPGHPVQGVEKLRQVVQALRVPVVAIGGIGRDNLQKTLETGVAAVAMIGALTLAPDIRQAARWFMTEFSRWKR
ncbi:MAG TPA: thiamine phosphate synthase [Deltaproteobacteria bacterium]|nr:thiamine phosphate synthase [Deltaproteobacteria bacterium]